MEPVKRFTKIEKEILGDLNAYTDPQHNEFDAELAYQLLFIYKPECFTDDQREVVKVQYDLLQLLESKPKRKKIPKAL